MPDDELHYLSLVALASRLRTRQLSPVEVVTAQLDRIDALDGLLHGFIRIDRDLALDQARRAEREIMAGETRGPLHGVPLGVKDNIWTAALETAAGSSQFAQYRPATDAASVERLMAAGAILLGKLTTTEFAGATYDPSVPVPVNPWNPRKWPGASSSGSAVAVAAGLCHGALGSDTGGSIRFPAAVNGILGLKPTWGSIPAHGMFHSIASMDHIGPMARHIDDIAALFDAMRHPGRPAATPGTEAASASPSRPLAQLRIGVDRAFGIDDADAATRRVMDAMLLRLEALGAEIVEARFPDHRGWMAALAAIHAREGTHYKETAAIAPSDQAISRMNEEYRSAIEWRDWLNGRIADLFAKVDLFMTPVLPMSDLDLAAGDAMETDASLFGDMLRYIIAFNFTGSPALAVPAGFGREGTPIGVQFAAAWGDEQRLFTVGRALQHVAGFDRLHPPVAGA